MQCYDIRTITLEQFRHLIASGNDRFDNQIRVSKNGDGIFISRDIWC